MGKISILSIFTLIVIAGCNANITDANRNDPTTSVTTTDNQLHFELTGINYLFQLDGKDSPDLVVKKGDKVTVTLTSTQGIHNFVIDEFDVGSEPVSIGQTTQVTFTASRKGTFEYYCSIGSHRLNGMSGKLIVN